MGNPFNKHSFTLDKGGGAKVVVKTLANVFHGFTFISKGRGGNSKVSTLYI